MFSTQISYLYLCLNQGVTPEKAVTITLATVALHSMLQTKRGQLYTDENALDKENEDGSVKEGNWRSIGANFLVNIPKNKNNHAQKSTEIHLLIIFMESRLFHGSGMYYSEQNR